MVLRLIPCSPRRPGFFATVARGLLHELSTSVGVPGPHGFAVRVSAARLAPLLRPSHPVPNVRDDRDTSLLWVETAETSGGDLPDGTSEKFFVRGLDRFSLTQLICPSGKSVAIYALCFSQSQRCSRRLRSIAAVPLIGT